MEDLQKEGKARSIGLSNYMLAQLEETLETGKVSRPRTFSECLMEDRRN